MQDFWAKAGAKVRQFSESANFLEKYFIKKNKKTTLLNISQDKECITPYYKYKSFASLRKVSYFSICLIHARVCAYK